MSHRWSRTILSLTVASLLITSCGKKFSSDQPLPVSYYPSVIISSDNYVVYAVNPATGAKNWQFSLPYADTIGTTGIPFKPSAIVYHERVYVTAANSDTVYKLNSNTGALIAKLTVSGHATVSYPLHFFNIAATPIADANMLYLATTNDTLYAIDTGTGETKWKFGAADGSAFNASPVIYNGNIYVATIGAGGMGSGVINGHMYCMNKTSGPDASGNPIWDYPGLGVVSNASFVSSPSVSAPFIYAGSASDSNMYCIYLNPPVPASPPVPLVGVANWTYKTGGNILSSPTTYAGICIFGSDDFYVYCLDTAAASIARNAYRWRYFTGGQVRTSPIISNQVVYAGSYDYYLYALNIIDGTKKWAYKTKGLIKSSPLPYNGAVYVGSYVNYLYSIDTAFGSLKWNFYVGGNIESSPCIDDLSGNNQLNSGISGYNTSTNTN